MLRRPLGAEGEAQIVVYVIEGGGVLKMVDGAVAFLGLLAPIGAGGLLSREQDGEALALYGLADELGVLGRESFLDGEDLGVPLTDDGELVTRLPVP